MSRRHSIVSNFKPGNRHTLHLYTFILFILLFMPPESVIREHNKKNIVFSPSVCLFVCPSVVRGKKMPISFQRFVIWALKFHMGTVCDKAFLMICTNNCSLSTMTLTFDLLFKNTFVVRLWQQSPFC